MRLIDADMIVYDEIGDGLLAVFKHNIDDEPTVELIRCHNCEKWGSEDSRCSHFRKITKSTDFCSYAVKALSYEEKTEKIMNGAKIVKTEIDGYGIKLMLGNGYVLNYDASDGGNSCWSIEKEVKNEAD